ncbi:MAG: hypothetical protein RML73_08965 [Anaerolineae bacterium]|nr:hypothetical protein [Anaerolineae bacterium]
MLKLLVVVLALVVSLLMLELLIRLSDPLGIIRYFIDTERFVFRLDDQVGYRLEPGRYIFTRSQATILDDRTRFVPSTNNDALCVIVALGDSVTFGQGVNDDEVWVNLLARRFPQVKFVNAGVPGYNLPNLVPQYERFRDRSHAILYTLIDNDLEVSISRRQSSTAWIIRHSALLLYVHALSLPRPPTMPESEYRAYLDTLLADWRVFITAFTGSRISHQLAKHYPQMMLQPLWTHNLSFFDKHPSPQGHEQIAQNAAPLVERIIRQACPGS